MNQQDKTLVLIEKLQSKDSMDRREAVKDLFVQYEQSDGDARAVEPLIHTLNDEEAETRGWAALALSIHSPPNAVELLVPMFNDDDETVRERAGRSLQKLLRKEEYRVDPTVLDTLIELVQGEGKYPDVRGWAARPLGSLGNPRAVEPLIEALKDESLTTGKHAIVDTLGKLGDSRASQPLIEYLQAQMKELVSSDIRVLSDSSRLVAYTAMALGEIGDPMAIDPLCDALRLSKYYEVLLQEEAVVALGKLGDVRVVPQLIQLLDDRNFDAHRGAIWALGKLGDVRAIEPLLLRLKDQEASSISVRKQAAKALLEIGDARVLKDIKRAYKTEKDQETREVISDVINKFKGKTSTSWLGTSRLNKQLMVLIAAGVIVVIGIIAAMTRYSRPPILQVRATTTAQALATVISHSSWPLLLSDAFDSVENGWFTGEVNNEFATGGQQVINGKYRWEVRANQGFHTWESPYDHSISDFYLIVEAKRVTGPQTGSYGVVFRVAENGAFYTFLVRDDGHFSVALMDRSEWTTLIDLTKTSTIRPSEVNRLTVNGEGTQFAFFINDQYVGEIDNSQLNSGTAGIAIELNAGEEVVFEFDNFELRTPQAQVLTLVSEGERLAQEGRIEEAIAAYDEAQDLEPTFEISAASWNTLCWHGSLWGYAVDVIKFCENAVQLSPVSDVNYFRDSRGLARALTEDYAGAIEDFKVFVEWSKENNVYEQYGVEREAWIAELEAGRNPFDEATLAKLREE